VRTGRELLLGLDVATTSSTAVVNTDMRAVDELFVHAGGEHPSLGSGTATADRRGAWAAVEGAAQLRVPGPGSRGDDVDLDAGGCDALELCWIGRRVGDEDVDLGQVGDLRESDAPDL